jgi:hypothetical protein
VLRTRSPVALAGPRDLHVLSTPPAFVLSQDQTLQEILIISSRTSLSYAVVTNFIRQRCPNHRKCSVKLFLAPRTGHQINEFASHIQIPKFNYQTATSMSRVAFRDSL